MDISQPLFTAIVLAADREPDNPVAKAAGVRCKSMAPVGGIPMIFRVLEALSFSGKVKDKILCGPPKIIMDQEPELSARVASGEVLWVANKTSPSSSAYHAMQSLPQDTPVLLTTADHALLSPRVVEHFCSEAQASGYDVVAAVALHETVMKVYPETRRTAYRLRDAAYCSCNLFAFLTPKARAAAYFWRSVENQRKKPLRLIRAFGWIAISRYLMGRLTLADGLHRVSHRLGFKAGVVIMPFPEAAIDVDSVSDWHLVNRITAEQGFYH
jgi:GTP:adenosylcobinamide-phosphate guanylyltransferase